MKNIGGVKSAGMQLNVDTAHVLGRVKNRNSYDKVPTDIIGMNPGARLRRTLFRKRALSRRNGDFQIDLLLDILKGMKSRVFPGRHG